MTGVSYFICTFNIQDTFCPFFFFPCFLGNKCPGIVENSYCMEAAACLKHCSSVGGRL